VISKVIK